ncbi:hypothetical protein M2428_002921 [Arthrobacter sp. ES3-54]|nr:hypothetical protein [Arthrobacter sp. ES3-54]
MHDRLPGRILFVHRAGIAVVRRQGPEHGVHGLVPVGAREPQHLVHFDGGLPGGPCPQHSERYQQAAGGRHHVPIRPFTAVSQEGDSQRQGGCPECLQFGSVHGAIHRSPFHAVGLQEHGGGGRTCGEGRNGSRRSNSGHLQRLHCCPPTGAPELLAGIRPSTVNQPEPGRTMPVRSRFAVVLVAGAVPVVPIRCAVRRVRRNRSGSPEVSSELGTFRRAGDFPANWGLSGELGGRLSAAGCSAGCSEPC